MQTCPECASANREGVLFCERCGKMLVPEQSPETDKLANAAPVAPMSLSWGTALFEKESSIVFHIGDDPKPLIVKPGRRLVLGRTDVASDVTPDIDLLPYGALSKGVSRKHAIIQRESEGLLLIDLGSRNSTYLNGQRLLPLQPRVIRDGDEIRLGALPLRIYFHKAGNSASRARNVLPLDQEARPYGEQLN